MLMNPPHPGELMKEDVITVLGLSVTVNAKKLGMFRVARAWLAMQVNYNLAQAKLHPQSRVKALQSESGN